MKTWSFRFRNSDGKTVTKQFKAESKKQAEELVSGFDILSGPESLKGGSRTTKKVK